MSIQVNEKSRVFSLRAGNMLYQMQADEGGRLLHLYWGRDTGAEMTRRIVFTDRGFSPNDYEMQNNRGISPDTLPQELGTAGAGDYRTPGLLTVAANGSRTADLRYAGYRILRGEKPFEDDMPFVRGSEETETLEIFLQDGTTNLRAVLRYRVFPEYQAITRSMTVFNDGTEPTTLEKAASAQMDVLRGQWDVIHFHGRHLMERVPERSPLPRGIMSFGSVRGMSSHHHNPFMILADRQTTDTAGDCYGWMLMYSGNHLEEIETDQAGSVRVTMGIHPQGFSWLLEPGDSFDTPEAILVWSGEGLDRLSLNYHALIREQVLPPAFRGAKKPVLINSWEAFYMDVSGEKLTALAREAKALDLDMVVLDDGWFGKRDDDCSGLGDWVPNETKMGGSLKQIGESIHREGLKFGLWMEPEMISEDSDLYRAHPDWALKDPKRLPTVGRNQLVLDFSRPEITRAILERMCAVLEEGSVDYLKWDFNRSVANVYSSALLPERQGEVAHRFIMGTYWVLARLKERFPALLIEGCAGGGGRFDAGMLYYCSQIWCSDDTDAIERLEIQEGTCYGYPPETMGSHVSAVPNHQTGRITPMETRAAVAMAGAFGYELDPAKLSAEEKDQIRRQAAAFRRREDLISHGNYYRLEEAGRDPDLKAWMNVSADSREALATVVRTRARGNGILPLLRLKGLKEEAKYRLESDGEIYTGAELMYSGVPLPALGNYEALQLCFEQAE